MKKATTVIAPTHIVGNGGDPQTLRSPRAPGDAQQHLHHVAEGGIQKASGRLADASGHILPAGPPGPMFQKAGGRSN